MEKYSRDLFTVSDDGKVFTAFMSDLSLPPVIYPPLFFIEGIQGAFKFVTTVHSGGDLIKVNYRINSGLTAHLFND